MPLYNGGNSFLLSASNYGATFTEAALGTALTAGGTNNTKNATPTQILAAASVTDDVYGVAIGFTAGELAGSARRHMVDIFVDPAGGTTWGSPIINNLVANNPAFEVGGCWYYFPLFIKAGSSIGAASQSETASAACRCLIKVFMKPTRLDILKVGTKVLTYGATTASTVGTTVTPGTSAYGSYSASLATLADNIFWWQMGVISTDGSQTARTEFYDVAVGDGSNKRLVLQDYMRVVIGTSEMNAFIPAYQIPSMGFAASGNSVFVRGASLSAPDTGMSAVVYGVAE